MEVRSLGLSLEDRYYAKLSGMFMLEQESSNVVLLLVKSGWIVTVVIFFVNETNLWKHSMTLFLRCLQVGNLGAPVSEWTVGGTALTSLMDVERRHGKIHSKTWASYSYHPILELKLF